MLFQVAMIEVYNEHIQDLLTEEQKGTLDVKMKGKRLFLDGLMEIEVQQEEDITKIMSMGDANRSVAATNMNSTRCALLLFSNVYVCHNFKGPAVPTMEHIVYIYHCTHHCLLSRLVGLIQFSIL